MRLIRNKKSRIRSLAPRHRLREELRARGIRVTRPREVLLSLIQKADDHIDAESLWRQAVQQDPRINLATVYRTLGMLKRFGLVDELDLMHVEGEKHYYEVSRLRSHIHVVCFRCGETRELQSPRFEQLRQEVEREFGFQVNTSRLEFGGLCSRCRSQISTAK